MAQRYKYDNTYTQPGGATDPTGIKVRSGQTGAENGTSGAELKYQGPSTGYTQPGFRVGSRPNLADRQRRTEGLDPSQIPSVESLLNHPGATAENAGETAGQPAQPKRSERTPYTWTPSQSTGYNPQQYRYQQMQDTTPQGQRISTDEDGMRGVSQGTRDANARIQQGYQQNDRVTQLQNQLQGIIDSRPQGYNSKYGAALDSIMQQIQNPDKFQYSFNGDELFKQYADMYTNMGRQASADAMGQAAGMTGGYGNSYAQQVGDQAYQQYLTQLFDRGDQLRSQAFNEWQANRADDYNRANALMNADEMQYGRYRDELGDWQTDRDWYNQAENQAYNRDYNEFAQDRDYWTQQAQMENADWWNAQEFNEQQRLNDANRRFQYENANAENQYRYDTLAEQQAQFGANFDEGVRQYNESMQESIREFEETSSLDWAKLEENQRQYDASLSEEQRQYDRNIAMQYVMAILQKGNMPSAELLIAAGISEEDAKKIYKKLTSGGGGGGSSSSSSGKSNSSGNNSKPKTIGNVGQNPVPVNSSNITIGAQVLAGLANGMNPSEEDKKKGISYIG